MIAAGDHAPPAGVDAVDPRNAVAVAVIVGDHARHHCIEVLGPLGVHADPGTGHRDEIEGGLGDHPGEPHAGDRRPELIRRVILRPQDPLAAKAIDQPHLVHMRAEGAGDVVVLAMDVGRDRAAHADHPGTRGHRHEEAARDDRAHDCVQAGPGPCG
jgi:hypothetical protein